MRTKTLLLTAAITAAGASASMAQVYSVNAVGYVNVTVPTSPNPASPVFALLANPLIASNANINTVLPLPESADGTGVFAFDVGTQNYVGEGFVGGVGWIPGTTDLPIGSGFFIQAQNTAGNTLNITFVGEVAQGAASNGNLPLAPNYILAASKVPQTATLGDSATPGTLQFPAEDGDGVFLWDMPSQSFVGYGYIGDAGAGGFWLPNDPTLQIATGFYAQKAPGKTQIAWVRNFQVSP